MIGATRAGRFRRFTIPRIAATAAGILIIACGKDSLTTAPQLSPTAPRLDVAPIPQTAFSTVVISQVYGGGGNSGATLKNDFIEIHNTGKVDASIDGWSVQYASSGGTSWQVTALTGTLAPGQYALIKEGAGAGGTTDLPTADFSGNIAMSATSGKVALVKSTTALSCGTSTAPCPGPDVIADFVGFGSSATAFEGSGPTATLANTTAALRKGEGCTETDNNGADFATGAPSPRNKPTTAVICPEAAPRVTWTTPRPFATLGDPAVLAVTFSEPVDVSGNWYGISCSISGAHTATVTDGPVAYQLSDLGEFAAGETCSATVFGARVADQDTDDPPDAVASDFTWTFKTEGEPVALPDTRFSEIHYENADDDVGEQIEIEGPAGTDLTGWSIVLYNGNGGAMYDTRALSGTIPATCTDRGVVVASYPTNGIQNGSPDGLALVHGTEVVQFLSYEGTMQAIDGPAAGMTSTDINVAESGGTSQVHSLQLNAKTHKWAAGRRSFGRCNSDGPPAFDISFSGREPASDPALPVGFEDQLFATMSDATGATVNTAFTWSSDTPELASIDQDGVMHAIAAGTAVFRATAQNGTSVTYALPITVATLGGTADYRGNTEFGIPTDGNASDDFIITRDQYTISYNQNRNTPNWVSYEFDITHFGTSVDRCDCFTHDPALPASFTHLTTADYTGAGAFAGYGIDRGHMARSFDFTSGSLDNARSYYLSNIIPQAAAVNQGPWKILEDSLGNLARFDGKEVYIIDGVAGNKGTVKGEGKIVMPAQVWKVAIVVPRDRGLAGITSFNDIDDVIAVIMPNDPTINADWKTYKTTVDEIERISGYDLLSALPDKLEQSVENNDVLAAKALNDVATAASEFATAAGLNAGQTNSLLAKIGAAQNQLGMGNTTPARSQLESLLNELSAIISSGRATDAQAATLEAAIQGVIDTLHQ
ncbi:MAG TPA: DNA/RNA non-specific endonuclease [Gemmatimonadaceae bacterium]|nr:DNA/RNA non-specific endonuclease [Gemmatimonadaceae bacterium]